MAGKNDREFVLKNHLEYAPEIRGNSYRHTKNGLKTATQNSRENFGARMFPKAVLRKGGPSADFHEIRKGLGLERGPKRSTSAYKPEEIGSMKLKALPEKEAN